MEKVADLADISMLGYAGDENGTTTMETFPGEKSIDGRQ